MGFFEKISAGLKKTRDSLMGRLEHLAAGFTKVDEDFFDELEETLIMGDVERQCDHEHHGPAPGSGAPCRHHRPQRGPRPAAGDHHRPDGRGESAGSLHQAVGGAGDRRQRCGQDHHHRQDGCTISRRRASRCCWQPQIPSALRPADQLAIWADRAGVELDPVTRRAATPPRWCLMPSTPARAGC